MFRDLDIYSRRTHNGERSLLWRMTWIAFAPVRFIQLNGPVDYCKYISGTKKSGALRRASMELTRALAEMRGRTR